MNQHILSESMNIFNEDSNEHGLDGVSNIEYIKGENGFFGGETQKIHKANVLQGDIAVMYKDDSMKYPVIRYFMDKDMQYKFKKKDSCGLYKDIYSKGLLIPQRLELNKTVFENKSKNQVELITEETSVDKFGNESLVYNEYGEHHISFDKWILIGACISYLERIRLQNYWNKTDFNDKYVYLSFKDIWKMIYPGRKYDKTLSKQKKNEWLKYCADTFEYLNTTGMKYFIRNWNKPNGYEEVYFKKILENDIVEEYVNGMFNPVGIKLSVKNNEIWNRVKGKHQWVYLYNYEINSKNMFGDKIAWKMQFYNIFVKYQIFTNNYAFEHQTIMRKKIKEHVFNKKDLIMAFRDGYFECNSIKGEYIDRMFNSITVKSLGEYNIFNRKKIKPARIKNFKRIGTSKWIWDIPDNTKGEDVLIKVNNKNWKIDENTMLLSDEIYNAQRKVHEINQENKLHVFEFNGHRVNSKLQVIFQGEHRGKKVIIKDKKYGRLYTRKNGVQSLKKEDRLKMTIDGEKVCEIDYSALHPHILYAMEHIDYKGDIYKLNSNFINKHKLSQEYARKAYKKMLLIMINAKSKARAINAFKVEWNEIQGQNKKKYIPWLYDLYDEISKNHYKIKKYFATGVGTELQYLDGKLMRNICQKLVRQGIAVGAVHDSVIVVKRYSKILKRIMQEEYFKMFSFGIDVDERKIKV